MFLKVEWIHHFQDEPILIYSELDDQRYEIRKIEIFRDGSMTFASEEKQTGSTFLSEMPLPTIEEIGRDPQFIPSIISAEEFHRLWAKAAGENVETIKPETD